MKTRDYKQFRNVMGNRKITPTHVQSLADAIERKNLLEYFPVLVNENMEVIDGQHRLMAAAKLDYDIYYEVVPGLQLENIMSINTHSKNWSVYDFIDAYIRLGNDDYVILKEFIMRNKLSASIAAGLLGGYSNAFTGGSHTGEKLRGGTFKVLSLDYAEKIVSMLNELKRHATFDVHKDRAFIKAVMSLNANEDFDFEKLLAKLRLSGQKIDKRANAKYYVIELEELYNFNAKIRTELYASSQLA